MKQKSYFNSSKTVILLLIMLLCYTDSMAKKKCVLNVGSFNISYDNKKGEQGWEKRKEFVVSLVRFHEFDVFGTQEGVSYQLNDIAGKEYDYVYADGFFNSKNPDIALEKSQHNGIFWLKDKFQLSDSGKFWLSETPDKKSFGWDAAESRGCVWAKLKEKKSGRSFYFFCVHLDHKGTIARQKSVLLILEKIREIAKGAPAFCTGDFNGTPDSEHIRTIKADGLLTDSRTISQTPLYGTKGTFNGYKKDSKMDAIFDYIWVTKGTKVDKFGVLNDMPYMLLLSDHFPIMIKAEI